MATFLRYQQALTWLTTFKDKNKNLLNWAILLEDSSQRRDESRSLTLSRMTGWAEAPDENIGCFMAEATSNNDMEIWQKNEECAQIMTWLRNNPEQQGFKIEQDILYKIEKVGDEEIRRIVLPQIKRKQYIEYYHTRT